MGGEGGGGLIFRFSVSIYWKYVNIYLSLFSYSLGKNKLVYCNKLLSFSKSLINPGSEFGNKNSFTKKSEHSEENSLPQAKKCLGFVKRFIEFEKEFI